MLSFLSIMASGFFMPVVAGLAMPSDFLSVIVLSSFMAGFSMLVACAIASGAKASPTETIVENSKLLRHDHPPSFEKGSMSLAIRGSEHVRLSFPLTNVTAFSRLRDNRKCAIRASPGAYRLRKP